MRLESSDGSSFELSIVGYEFPGRSAKFPGFDDDANWLVVMGRASDGERSWSFREPCLITTEARELAVWLDAVADGRPDVEAIDFTEPNLEFHRVETIEGFIVVRVIFRLESRPRWMAETTLPDWDREYLDFDMSPDAWRAAAVDLRTQLDRFPVR